MRAFEFNYGDCEFPEDMTKIMLYLEEHGRVNVSVEHVEKFYRQYSDEVWCAGWMNADEHTVQSFAHWLAEQEL